MKFDIKDGKSLEFLAGLGMLIAGVIMFTKNIYVTTPFLTGQFSVGGIYLRSGIFVLPLIAGLIWMFFKPEKTFPKVLSVLGFVLIIAMAISSVTIRVGAISLVKWIIILVLIFGGLLLSARAVKLKRKK